MNEEQKRGRILKEIILGYRRVIEKRYDYQIIRQRSDFPDSFGEARVNQFKAYFLDYIYPLPEKRETLNKAFAEVDNYIKNPDKLIRILIDSTSLVFKYGLHLPKILRTGLMALQSFRRANNFEESLVEKALLLQMDPPYSSLDIDKLIAHLSKEEVEDFIESGQNLFETLHNRALMAKLKEIIDELIRKMKKRPNVYTPAEINGLEMGREIIVKGDSLFEKLSKEEQAIIFSFIIKTEREVVEKIFSK